MEETTKESKSIEKKAKKEVVGTRGRVFQGFVIKKFPKRVVIQFDKTVKVQKYERFLKKTTVLHARLPDELESQVNVGDDVRVGECRPLSKIIHFIVLGKARAIEEKKIPVKDLTETKEEKQK